MSWSKARDKFLESHPNVVYYNSKTVYYCPMVVNCPLAGCEDSPTFKYPVWVTFNGKEFEQGYVMNYSSDSLFKHGKVIYFKDKLVSIDTANFRFEVY